MIYAFNTWVGLTLLAFYYGPVDWPHNDNIFIAVYVAICLAAFNIGALLPQRVAAGPSILEGLVPKSGTLIALLTAVYVFAVLFQVASLADKNPLLPSSYVIESADLYETTTENAENEEGGAASQILLLLRSLLFPLVLMAAFQSRRYGWMIIVSICAVFIVAGLLKARDKEISDAILIAVMFLYLKGRFNRVLVASMVAIPLFFMVFLARRQSRVGDYTLSCLPETEVCFNFSSTVAKTFGADAEILYLFVVNYIAQGYQGLSYALDLRYDFHYFLGHLEPVRINVCKISSAICGNPTYADKLQVIGWPAPNKWTTAYTWLANDLTFWLVPAYMAFLGYIFRDFQQSWRSYRDASAACGIVLVTQFFAFSSGTFQPGISLEWAFATIAFFYLRFFLPRQPV